jgi:hypothetical protein
MRIFRPPLVTAAAADENAHVAHALMNHPVSWLFLASR